MSLKLFPLVIDQKNIQEHASQTTIVAILHLEVKQNS